MKPSFLSDLAFSVGLSFKKPTCFYLSSLRKPFICKDFRSCFRDPNFGKQLLQHRPICPIAPVLLGHFRATPNSFFDHLVNNDDILVLFGGFLCCGRGTLQTFEKSTQTAHRPLENEQTHTLWTGYDTRRLMGSRKRAAYMIWLLRFLAEAILSTLVMSNGIIWGCVIWFFWWHVGCPGGAVGALPNRLCRSAYLRPKAPFIRSCGLCMISLVL